ncbi:hypothetical protein [Pseudochrobactrum sp. MP213Fo]|uniref:hypothetical protein n=1 Tax=Pseudochrobactrum sp. MP213Fo TaxID=3022250 RepID=UPI003B9E2725
MSNMLNLFGFSNTAPDLSETVSSSHKSSKTTLLSVHALREAAARLADLRADGASLNTREFVGLLMCNAQRSRRISLPDASLRIMTNNPVGRVAIRIKLR